MRATAAQLGDSDALAALRIGDEPTTRKASQVIEKALWACGGLIVDDLRESEYTWVYRNVYDAYLEAFQDAAEPYDYDASGAA